MKTNGKCVFWSRQVPTEKRTAFLAFLLGISLYIFTRFFDLSGFPCYFHADEAIHGIHARHLVTHNLHDNEGRFLPLYFRNGWNLNLCTSVYLNALTTLVFGESIEVLRGTTAAIGIILPLTLSWILYVVFRQRTWWAASWYLISLPIWAIHSRTAFEVGMFVPFYAVMIGGYYAWRMERRFGALICLTGATLAFYSYSAAQIVVPATFAGLLISDFSYVYRRKERVIPLVLVAALCLTPVVLFRLENPDLVSQQLAMTGSHLVTQMSLKEKVVISAINYLSYLDPRHWFLSTDPNIRHRIGDHPFALTITLPFFIIGTLLCLRHIKEWRYRIPLMCYLCMPTPGLLGAPSSGRSMTVVIPLTLLTVLGFERVLNICGFLRRVIAPLIFTAIVSSTALFVFQSWSDRCTWTSDFGLYGYQWGGIDLFRRQIPEFQKKFPSRPLWISTSWANTPEYIFDYLKHSTTIRSTSAEELLAAYIPDMDKATLVLTREEYQQILESPKIVDEHIVQIQSDPSGKPFLYFLEARYADDLSKILEDESKAMSRLSQRQLNVQKQTLTVSFPILDIGHVEDMFDGNDTTLVRGKVAYPFRLIVELQDPIPLKGLLLTSFNSDLEITLRIQASGQSPEEFVAFSRVEQNSTYSTYSVKFPERLCGVLEIEARYSGRPTMSKANIHINELRFED